MSLPVDPAVQRGVQRMLMQQLATQMLEQSSKALGGASAAPYTATFAQVLADAVTPATPATPKGL